LTQAPAAIRFTGYHHVHPRDPFGNRIELIEELE